MFTKLIINVVVIPPPTAKNKILKEGWLQYSVMGMNSKKWFVVLSDEPAMVGFANEDKTGDIIINLIIIITFVSLIVRR